MSYTPPPFQPVPPQTWGGSIPSVVHNPAERPTAAMVLSIIGGVFILLGGLFEIGLASYLASLTLGAAGGFLAIFGLVGVVLGVLIIIFGVLVHMHPETHMTFGILILVLSIVSLASFAGGFVIGFVLALVGGILAMTWKPTPVLMYYPPAAPVQRLCPKCGRVLDPTVRFCPYCGNSVG
jgi:hypothetical protein